MSDGTANGPESAIQFDDIQLSRVVYHEVTAESSTLWIMFEIDEPQSLFLSLGLPLIDRLADFRPAFAVIGPGLPAGDAPFEIPEGLGGLTFETEDVAEPEVFYEPFSRTSSWILREEHVDLPEAGTYFIVAYVPSGETGKLWLAPGDREEFTLADIAALSGILPEVKTFHEVEDTGVPCFLLPLGMILGLSWGLRLLSSRARQQSTQVGRGREQARERHSL
jgi:hypothetical protein